MSTKNIFIAAPTTSIEELLEGIDLCYKSLSDSDAECNENIKKTSSQKNKKNYKRKKILNFSDFYDDFMSQDAKELARILDEIEQ